MTRLFPSSLRSYGFIHGRDEIHHFFKASRLVLGPQTLLISEHYIHAFKSDQVDRISYTIGVQYWVFFLQVLTKEL
jgi:hypothetical protein